MPDENEQLREVLTSQIEATPNSSFFIRMPQEDSLLTGVTIFSRLVTMQNKKGVYLTCNANATSEFLTNYLGAHNIDTSKVTFIDTISKTFLARKNLKSSGNTIFTEGSITDASIESLRNAITSNPEASFMYLDSLTELLKFHDENEVGRFLVKLISTLRAQKMTGLILSYYGGREAELAESVMNYCDYYIEF